MKGEIQSDRIFTVHLDGDKNTEELLEKGNYAAIVRQYITKEGFAVKKHPPVTRQIALFKPTPKDIPFSVRVFLKLISYSSKVYKSGGDKKFVSCELALAELKQAQSGLLQPTYEEALYFGIQHPNAVGDHELVIFPHEPVLCPGGEKRVLVFVRINGELQLQTREFCFKYYPSGVVFAAIRREPSISELIKQLRIDKQASLKKAQAAQKEEREKISEIAHRLLGREPKRIEIFRIGQQLEGACPEVRRRLENCFFSNEDRLFVIKNHPALAMLAWEGMNWGRTAENLLFIIEYGPEEARKAAWEKLKDRYPEKSHFAYVAVYGNGLQREAIGKFLECNPSSEEVNRLALQCFLTRQELEKEYGEPLPSPSLLAEERNRTEKNEERRLCRQPPQLTKPSKHQIREMALELLA